MFGKSPVIPLLAFGAGSLARGNGGIAELSRQVVKVLIEMHVSGQIRLKIFVLEDEGTETSTDLLDASHFSDIVCYAGNRRKFSFDLLRCRADLVLYDHAGLARLQGLMHRVVHAPYALLIHSVEIWNNHRKDYHRTARNAQWLIANSAYTADKARRHYPDLPEILVCWPGKDESSSQSASNHQGPQNIGPHALLIVGRLDTKQRHKGHDQLLEAMPLILDSVADAKFIIAGGGDDRERLEDKARELGVADHCVFLGKVDEENLNWLYRNCALFVMPSDGDGFGLVFLEAMMHGLPCVGLDKGAAAEIFDKGKYGVLVDREDLHGMANCLSGLLLDKPRRKALGVTAKERYVAYFQGRHHAQRFRAILEQKLDL